MQTDRLYFRISADLKRRLEALAQADRRQVSDYVRLILEDHVAKKENNGSQPTFTHTAHPASRGQGKGDNNERPYNDCD